MSAEYDGMLVHMEKKQDMAEIWRYQKTEGFERKETGCGREYWAKDVDPSDLDGPFNISFLAFWDGLWLIVDRMDEGMVHAICCDREYAQDHGFVESEHGIWKVQMPVGWFDRFQMLKRYEDGRKNGTEETELDRKKFLETWKKYTNGA